MSIIKSLDITNFQKLSRAVIEPSGNVIMLCGKNANGKTSMLDAIQAGWCGHDSRTIKRPIKDGHGKASIDITMTDGTVLTRKYTPSGTTLTAKAADGSKLGQKDLDRMISSLGVDAAAFIMAGEKKQLETLLSVVDLPFVPAELDAQRKAIEGKRLLVGQQGKAIGDVTVDPNLTSKEISVSGLVAELRIAEDAHRDHAAAQHQYSAATSRLEQAKQELKDATDSLKNAADSLARWDSQPLPDVDDIRLNIDTAEESNAAIRANNTAREQAAKKEELRTQYSTHTAEIEAIDKTKADGLANAQMPVEGLSFDEEGVLYQGVPFSRASGAEQIIVSAAMIIATDPEVRTMVIRNGNVMDTDSLAVLQTMCEDNNFQAFVEFVSDSEDHEFRLVDGELAA